MSGKKARGDGAVEPRADSAAGAGGGASSAHSLAKAVSHIDSHALVRHSPVRVVFGAGTLARLGELARAEGAQRVLLVTDPGLERAGHASRAEASLRDAALEVFVFDGVRENPTTEHVAAGVAAARKAQIDFIVAVGGGSAMDCAKGVNVLLTNGGKISDYCGVDKARAPMLPLIAVPTTAGTGSEAQSFALISDAVTHAKMACGDRRAPHEGGLRPRVAILDPDLTRTQPRDVAIAAGIDAISHAVETAATNVRTELSRACSRAAWEQLDRSFEPAIADADDHHARADMLFGAHLAGMAIENSMLGAAHACANPLTVRYNTTHGVAVGLMLPHVIHFNAEGGTNPYADLHPDAAALAARVEHLLAAGRLPRALREVGVPQDDLAELAAAAATQWTARFNPRATSQAELLELYRRAF